MLAANQLLISAILHKILELPRFRLPFAGRGAA
jgi:hypothetical protein